MKEPNATERDDQTWTLTLQPVPGWSTPGVQRLRSALKALLRSFGLKCVRLVPDNIGAGDER